MEKSLHIHELEKCLAIGDLSGMAETMGALHETWDLLSASEQQEVLKLEAVFHSLIQLQTGER